MKRHYIYMYLFLLLLPHRNVQAQYIPVGSVIDEELLASNGVVLVVESVINWLLDEERSLQEKIHDVQQFFFKASTIVNGAIENMRMIRYIVDTSDDITELYSRALQRLNTPLDSDQDGINDLDFLNKWKHIQILLAFTEEATGAFELLNNLVEDDAFTMNDRGRIRFIEKTYYDMRRIKSAMRLHLRRINREIFQYRRQRSELLTYEKFFS